MRIGTSWWGACACGVALRPPLSACASRGRSVRHSLYIGIADAVGLARCAPPLQPWLGVARGGWLEPWPSCGWARGDSTIMRQIRQRVGAMAGGWGLFRTFASQ